MCWYFIDYECVCLLQPGDNHDAIDTLLQRILNLQMEAVCFSETPVTTSIGLFTEDFS